MSVLLRLVRRLATAPLVGRLTAVSPLLRLSFALRASLVRERVRFVRNELRRDSVTAVYGLRASGIAIAIRHHTGDVMVLDEIFSQGEYDPPAGVTLDGPEPLSVVDLGANVGLFGAWLLGRLPNARILAYEADPDNAAVHRLTIEANGLTHRWQLVQAFAANRPGTTAFAAGRHALSRAGEGIEVPAVDVMPKLAQADIVKIDIEGAEWPILADPRFRALRAAKVVLEYHGEGAPGPDPDEEAERALADAGYRVVHASRKPAFGAGLLWGVRS